MPANNLQVSQYNIMHIDISKATLADLKPILRLQKECYQTEAEIYNDYDIPPLLQDLKALEEEFAQITILKAEIRGELVGSVRGYIDNETAHIGKLIVAPDFQNRGIGRLLIGAIESTLAGCQQFELFTGSLSSKNLYLYSKLGYQEFYRQEASNHLTMIFLRKPNTNERTQILL
ncbi:MAG: putative acetyltransferase [Bacteroidetes bacterium]|nr:putative acetyltransferase [Bacteroidota bacterium]